MFVSCGAVVDRIWTTIGSLFESYTSLGWVFLAHLTTQIAMAWWLADRPNRPLTPREPAAFDHYRHILRPEYERCPVCWESLNSENAFVSSEAQCLRLHPLCRDCIEKLFESRRPLCPLCRTSLWPSRATSRNMITDFSELNREFARYLASLSHLEPRFAGITEITPNVIRALITSQHVNDLIEHIETNPLYVMLALWHINAFRQVPIHLSR